MGADVPDGVTPSTQQSSETLRDVELRSVVVEYEGAPNRCTLYPADATEDERLTHWLTANEDAFTYLDEHR